MVLDGLVARLRGVVGARGVVTDPVELRTYACDGLTGHRVVPGVAVLPRTADEVAGVVRACVAAGVPYVARGAGTGLSGGALPVADGVLVVLAKMRRILGVDAANRRITVEPGVTNAEVTKAVAVHGLYYAPDPSSQIVCTIGGNVAENSGGVHCLKYGFTTHHVVGLELVTPDGDVVTVGDLAGVLDAPGYDLRGVVVGSEGTLGIVTKVTLRLLRKPEVARTLVADFTTTSAAGDAVTAITRAGVIPAGIEMIDHLAIQACEEDAHAGFNRDAGALLLVELDGPQAEVAALFDAVVAHCRQAGATAIRVAADEADRARIWRGRKSAFAAMGRLAPNYIVQDGVIPRTQLGPVLAAITALGAETGFRVANVFHAGDGNLHPLVLYDAAKDETAAAEAVATRIVQLCVDAGGSITGEHGVGIDKACSMPKMFGEDDLAVMQRVRAAFDPAGLATRARSSRRHACAASAPAPTAPTPWRRRA